MTIVRWILATALAVAFLLLAVANWTQVPFRLPDGTIVNIHLPLLLAAAFVAGWLPTWLILVGTRAQHNRKLAKAVPAAMIAPAPPAPEPAPPASEPAPPAPEPAPPAPEPVPPALGPAPPASEPNAPAGL